MFSLYTVEQVKAAERKFADSDHELRLLMYRAGQSLARRAAEMCPDRPIAVLCGRGNNGGDGFAAAWELHSKGIPTVTFGEATGTDPCFFKEQFELLGGKTYTLSDFFEFKEYGLIIDALFGTGLSRAPEGIYADVINKVNSAEVPVLSADIPSGIGAEGLLFLPHVRATETVTFVRPKPATFMGETYRAFGKVRLDDLAVTEEYCSAPHLFVTDGEQALHSVPDRDVLTHKGNYPRVALFVGAVGYSGAAILSVRAALRSGAGLVFAGVPESIYGIVASACPEAVVFPLKEEGGALCAAALPEALRRAERADAVLCGCGLSKTAGTREFLFGLIEECKSPLVLDADGINLLSGHTDMLKKAESLPILTPHMGELAGIAGKPPIRPGEAPADAAVRLARELGCILVMKGHHTLIAHPDGRVFINTTGNPGMARGGSGDVLAGMVTVISAGQRTLEAVAAAVYFHGRAGDVTAERLGQTAMLPGDMIDNLPEAFYRK